MAFAQLHGLGPQLSPQVDPPEKKPGDWSKITNLKLFTCAKSLLSALEWDHFSTQYPDLGPKLLQRQIFEIIALIGAGFYSYRRQAKIQLYQQGREKLGAIVAWYYFLALPTSNPTPDTILAIEEDLLPMFGALIGHLEKDHHR